VKIFVGGMKKHHQERFVRMHPDVEFTFAAFDDPIPKWAREAGKAQYAIIDQSRCEHKTIAYLRCHSVAQLFFTDSKAKMHEIIDDLRRDGSYQQVYTAWVGGGV